MKKIILLISFAICLISQTTFAQRNNSSIGNSNLSKLYATAGYGLANGRLTGIGLNFIYLNNWGFSLSYNKLERPAKELSPNYQNGSCTILGCSDPIDVLNIYSFRILKEFSTKTRFVRFGLEGGISFVSLKPADLSNYNNSSSNVNYSSGSSGYFGGGGLLGSGFNVLGSYSGYSGGSSDNDNNTAGLSFRAKVAFPIARWIGLEIAAISNINRLQSYVGGEMCLTIGLVRDKI